MKRKKASILIGILACSIIMAIPVCAKNSQLDVREGDRKSYSTYKDVDSSPSGQCYYVTARTYVGYPVMGHSYAVNGAYSSPYTIMQNKVGGEYSYGEKVYGGIYCILETGPSYMSGSNWHLTGVYCP